MVVLGSHDAALPGRYWGEGQEPVASPSQASLLLARLNERARARKASLGKGTEKDRQGTDRNRQGSLGSELRTPEQRLTREDKEEAISGSVATPTKTQNTTQSSSDVKPKVNGVKVSEPFAEEAEIVKKRKEAEETDALTSGGSTLEILTAEQSGSVEESVGKKKKKKRKQEEEERTVGAEGLVSSQDEEGSESCVKKKKRRKEEEEEGGEERGAMEPVMSEVAMDDTEGEFKRKKKKKKQEKVFVAVDESGSVVKKEEKNENIDTAIDDTRTEEAISEGPQTKKKKKRKKGEEEEEMKTVKREMKEEQISDTHQPETAEDAHSPATQRKKKKKAIKSEPTEDGNRDSSAPLKVPKVRMKEEIIDRIEGLGLENKEEEEKEEKEAAVDNHIEGGGEEEKEEEDAETKKTKKREKKKKKKKIKEGKKTREVKGFTLLTEVETTKKQKVHRTLPHWLAHPTVIGRDLMADGTPVDSLPGLDPSLKDLLKQQKVTQLFPVQRVVIPEILAGAGTLACRFQPRDVCVSAPTGSGKTLAYVLPLVQALRCRTVPRIRALVLLPVQELATQVFHVFQTYCRGSPLRVGKAIGHSTVQKEQAALVAHHLGRHHSLVDILVATPGRLADHLRMTRGLDLSALRYLVLDEADRMLAAEGGDWVGHVQRAISDHQAASRASHSLPLPHPPLQRLLFSATLSSDPEQLQHVTLRHPKLFTVAAPAAGRDKSAAVVIGQYVRPSELREEYVMVEEEVKPLALHHLLVSGEGRHRVLVFTNSVHATHKLALLLAALSRGSERVVAEFSSKKEKRQQIVSQFAAGKIDVLVSSDAMARGLDIPDIDHVVSYDVTATTTYVHRIGRTARAGRPGTALSIVTKSTMGEFRRALSGGGEGACQLTLTPEELEPYEQQYIDALATLKATLEEEEREKRQNHSADGKAKKKQKKKKRLRKQRRDLRTARLAERKAGDGRGKATVSANRLRHQR